MFFFLMIRRPPRSTLDRSSAASDVYKRQLQRPERDSVGGGPVGRRHETFKTEVTEELHGAPAVSYTHLRAHETVLEIVCRLLLEKKNLFHTYDTTRAHDTILTRLVLLDQ